MHVCHLVHHLANGGLEQQILELVRQSDDEVEYTVCYLDEDDSLAGEMREAGGTVVGLDVTSGPRSVFNPLAVWKLSAFLREQEFDLLHVHTPLYVQVMGRIAAAFGGPEHVVGTYHNPRENFHPAMRYLESATRRLSSVNVGVSLAVERSFTGSATKYEPGQGLPGASCTIYNGIDVDAFAERVSSADADAVREEYGLEDETVFLNIGRYSEQKAQKDLIRAMEYVVEEIPDSHLFIVGWGPLEEELRQTVCEYGLQEYITVTGKVPTVEEYYAVADVFVLSSIQEGLPIVILEAMAASLPLIVTDVSGNSEAISEGETGLLVSPKSSSELADSMINTTIKNISKPYGTKGRKRAKQKFDIKRTNKSYIALYRSLSKNKRYVERISEIL